MKIKHLNKQNMEKGLIQRKSVDNEFPKSLHNFTAQLAFQQLGLQHLLDPPDGDLMSLFSKVIHRWRQCTVCIQTSMYSYRRIKKLTSLHVQPTHKPWNTLKHKYMLPFCVNLFAILFLMETTMNQACCLLRSLGQIYFWDWTSLADLIHRCFNCWH